MDKDTQFPNRKHPRLKDYDYSQEGAYFITICSHKRKNIFSTIKIEQDLETATVELTKAGFVAQKYIFEMEQRYNITVASSVIMPNHIHMLLVIDNKNRDIKDIICAYKSLVARECKKIINIDKIFQTSFFDHVIRNEKDFFNTVEYIAHNPGKWIYDKYYSDGTITT